MLTRQDMEIELGNRLMAATNSTQYSPARLTELIKQAHFWATGMFFWPGLQRGRKTNTIAGQDYYDYPTDFKDASISRLSIDGQPYKRKSFQSFRDYVDDPNTPPEPTTYYFANYGRQYFAWPVPKTNGSDNLVIWGNIQAPDLANPTDTTIFSTWKADGNEAIVKKAIHAGLARIAPQEAMQAEADAKQTLTDMWATVTAELQRDQPLNQPLFDVPDFFGPTNSQANLGNFNLEIRG